MIGWLATICVLISVILLGQMVVVGWLFGMVSNILWVAHGARRHDNPIIVVNICFFAINIMGYVSWLT